MFKIVLLRVNHFYYVGFDGEKYFLTRSKVDAYNFNKEEVKGKFSYEWNKGCFIAEIKESLGYKECESVDFSVIREM